MTKPISYTRCNTFFKQHHLSVQNPLPFETEPYTIHTIPLAREHCDSYLYYIRYKTLEIPQSQNPFQVIFNPVKGISAGTYYRTIHPQSITLSILDVSLTYMRKLLNLMTTKIHHSIFLLT